MKYLVLMVLIQPFLWAASSFFATNSAATAAWTGAASFISLIVGIILTLSEWRHK